MSCIFGLQCLGLLFARFGLACKVMVSEVLRFWERDVNGRSFPW